MTIKITGNTSFFQQDLPKGCVSNNSFSLEFKNQNEILTPENENIILLRNDMPIGNIKLEKLFQFIKKQKGVDFKLFYQLIKESVNNFTLNKLTYQEIDIIKSLFLVFDYLNPIYIPYLHEEFNTILFDNIMIDSNGMPGTQKDIYLLPTNFSLFSINYSLQKLKEVNLLCLLDVITPNFKIKNYYVPLLKPGVSIKYLSSEYDNSGKNTLTILQRILQCRENKIKHIVQ